MPRGSNSSQQKGINQYGTGNENRMREMPCAADTHGKGVYLFLRMHLLPELHGFDRYDLFQLRWRVGQASDPMAQWQSRRRRLAAPTSA